MNSPIGAGYCCVKHLRKFLLIMKAKAGNIARYFHLGYCWLIIKAHLKELYLKMKLQGNWFQYKRRDQKSVGSAHKDIFVSLTSHPPRFCTLHLTLKSLLIQSVRPKELILWIGNEENNQPASSKRLWDYSLSNAPINTGNPCSATKGGQSPRFGGDRFFLPYSPKK